MHKERANGEWVSDRRLACSSSVSRPPRMHFCGRFLVSRYRWQQHSAAETFGREHSAEHIRPSRHSAALQYNNYIVAAGAVMPKTKTRVETKEFQFSHLTLHGCNVCVRPSQACTPHAGGYTRACAMVLNITEA